MITEKNTKPPIANYPIVDGHRRHYFLHPVQSPTTLKWRGADVLHNGYADPFQLPYKVDSDSEADCQKACDIHNSWLMQSEGLVPETADLVIGYSMNLFNVQLDINDCRKEAANA